VLVALQLLSFIERITKELFSQFDFLSYLPTNNTHHFIFRVSGIIALNSLHIEQ
jgi:hypothetical protein